MLRKTMLVLAAASAALTAVPAAPAYADKGQITDKAGDTRKAPAPKADYDIVKAGWGHKSHGRLVHWVQVAGAIGDPKASGFAGSLPDVVINVPGQVADNPTCDYFVEPLPPGAGPNTGSTVKWYIYKCSNTPTDPVGTATATRANSHRINIVFKRRAIGSPAKYGWYVDFPSDGDNPPYDRAPNKGWKWHRP